MTEPSKTKHGHLAIPDPEWAALRPAVDAGMAQLWALPVPTIRSLLLEAAADTLPADIPQELLVTNTVAPVRDGTSRGIRVYKSRETERRRGEGGKNGAAPLFFVMHGGGWVVGGHGVEEAMNRYVAQRCGAVVVSVDYRMAPEWRYPYAVNDSFDVLKWCQENATLLGINPQRIILGGSSAGGNLAAVLTLKARAEKFTGIIGQVLNCPVTCHPDVFPNNRGYEYDSWRQNAEAPVLDAKRMRWFWDHYVLEKATNDPYHSPLLASSLKGLPPALVQVAGLDPLRDEGIAYAEALKAAGVPTTTEIYPGVPHCFGGFSTLSKATQHWNAVTDFVSEILGQFSSRTDAKL